MADVEGHGAPASCDSLGALKGNENALAEETRQGGGGSWGGARNSHASGALPKEVVKRTAEAVVGLHGERSECVAKE